MALKGAAPLIIGVAALDRRRAATSSNCSNQEHGNSDMVNQGHSVARTFSLSFDIENAPLKPTTWIMERTWKRWLLQHGMNSTIVKINIAEQTAGPSRPTYSTNYKPVTARAASPHIESCLKLLCH